MTGTWLSKGTQRHVCPTPRRRERRREGAGLGSVWMCPCGQAWQFVADRMFGDHEWRAITKMELDALNLPIMQSPPFPA